MTSRVFATCERSDGRDLARWCVAPASVLQGVVTSHFAGRCRFGEHDAAGMERRGYPACAALSHISGRDPVVKWNAG